jgi:hypothetical protein
MEPEGMGSVRAEESEEWGMSVQVRCVLAQQGFGICAQHRGSLYRKQVPPSGGGGGFGANAACRDGYPTDPELLFLTNGASDGVGKWMDMLISSSNDGTWIEFLAHILIPWVVCCFQG